MKTKSKVLAGGALLFTALAGMVLFTLYRGGAFFTVEPHGPAPVRTITGFPGGTEDLVVREGGREAWVSSADFSDVKKQGGIFVVDLDGGPLRNVTPELDFKFSPHGIGLWTGPDGAQRLFVVNHRGGSGFTRVSGHVAGEHTIDVFDVAADGSLSYVRSHSSPALISPNDVAPSGADTFYVTNDHGYGPGLVRYAEDYLQLGLGNVLYFDGSEFREVHGGTKYANGIGITPDGRTLYLAETIGGRVTQFYRDARTGALHLTTQTDWVSGLDNLTVAADGSVWVAAHPKLLAFVEHAKDPATRLSPSQVLRFQFGAKGEWSVEEVYLNDGTPVSGGSVAAPTDDAIVLGAVMQPKVVVLPR